MVTKMLFDLYKKLMEYYLERPGSVTPEMLSALQESAQYLRFMKFED